ncbi:hypothetical protein T4E_9991 [Trichinella pseudospiralis]|uniref:Uncharacterized protein n=1 Tax=Trichinella pseudospiralis TaxID=6337 RepID=A0A0V0YK08_TRIPS|nr:hypothetical protein T4E_9991 [Trichinella pseudospiralis]
MSRSVFLSTDTDQISLLLVLGFTNCIRIVYKNYTSSESRELFGSSKKYAVVYVYANNVFKRMYNCTFVSLHGNYGDSSNCSNSTVIGGIKALLSS